MAANWSLRDLRDSQVHALAEFGGKLLTLVDTKLTPVSLRFETWPGPYLGRNLAAKLISIGSILIKELRSLGLDRLINILNWERISH